MKIIRTMLIIVLFSTSSYASDWGGALQGVGQGMSQGIEDAQRMEEIRMMKEQRQQLEQQRLDAEQRRAREEQHVREEEHAREEQRVREEERAREEQKIKSDQFISYMNDKVPNWRTIDNDPAFIKWLDSPVPYTNFTKMQLLKDYAANLNAPMAAQFFIDYKLDRLRNCENKCSSLHKKKKLQASCKEQCKESTENKSIEAVSTKPTMMLSKDESFKITLPGGWIQGTPSPSQQLVAENHLIDADLSIKSFNSADMQDWKSYLESGMAKLSGKLSQSTSYQLRKIKVNGFNALQADISGTIDGIKAHYIVTLIKTDKKFIQLLIWCMESSFAANRKELESIASGLQI